MLPNAHSATFKQGVMGTSEAMTSGQMKDIHVIVQKQFKGHRPFQHAEMHFLNRKTN